jgi:hypothetical protein
MFRFNKSMAGAAAGLATLMLLPAPGFAAAEITTVDGSLVQRFEVDRHTGEMRNAE